MSYYFLIGLMVALTVSGQLMVKHGVSLLGTISLSGKNILFFLAKSLSNIYVLGGLGLYFIAALLWLIALTKIPLSRGYPFMALSFALVSLLAARIFHEPTSWFNWLGLAIICLGLVLVVAK